MIARVPDALRAEIPEAALRGMDADDAVLRYRSLPLVVLT